MSSIDTLSTGSLVKVQWKTVSGGADTYIAQIIGIRKSRQSEDRVFSLQFVDLKSDLQAPVIRKTKLSHLQWSSVSLDAMEQREIAMESKDTKKRSHAAIVSSDNAPKKKMASNIVVNPKISHLLMKKYILPDYKYILAPMVGGSELPFRLLCRRYGATLAYTPMMNSNKFAFDEEYRKEQFQTNEHDRPLVAHFAANDPEIILKATKLIEDQCDAVDINLGCPQRIAFTGHFGSYLLDEADRELVTNIVHTLYKGLKIPVFVKIRLLDTIPDTIRLCRQLIEAGASLIAIHARYRVNLVGRTGPGARDGAAHLDQVKDIKQVLLSEGYDVPIIANGNVKDWKDVIENKEFCASDGIMSAEGLLDNPALFYSLMNEDPSVSRDMSPIAPLQLAREYVALVQSHPTPIKTVIFHLRRICRDLLTKYQLFEDLVASTDLCRISTVLNQMETYENDPEQFKYDKVKEKEMKEALERRKANEGKRKEFEARMIRKAKREGKALDFYLKQGAELPSVEDLLVMKSMKRDESFKIWKDKYSQHCYAYHFEPSKCPRERACAFLHADATMSEDIAYG